MDRETGMDQVFDTSLISDLVNYSSSLVWFDMKRSPLSIACFKRVINLQNAWVVLSNQTAKDHDRTQIVFNCSLSKDYSLVTGKNIQSDNEAANNRLGSHFTLACGQEHT